MTDDELFEAEGAEVRLLLALAGAAESAVPYLDHPDKWVRLEAIRVILDASIAGQYIALAQRLRALEAAR